VLVFIEGVVKLFVPVPLDKGEEPPAAAPYQSITAPSEGVAVSTTVPSPQREAPVVEFTVGNACTVADRITSVL
jgi:hypothetical protein